MQLNTIMPYWQTATVMSYTEVQNPDTGNITRSYYEDGRVRIRLISKNVGDSVVYTDRRLPPFTRLIDVLDRAGESATDNQYLVKLELPTINALGFADGYSYKVSRE